jgi:uncharacterized protein YbjT (DUF2867 family)
VVVMIDAVLVTGATGGTGSALLELLVSRGVGVRAMVRCEGDATRIAAMGVDAVVADFDDDAASGNALQGVDRVYVVTPSSERAEDQQRRFIELAASAGVQQVVKLSQLGADESSPVRFLRWHAAVERRVRELGVATRSCVRTCSFKDSSRSPARSRQKGASSPQSVTLA